MSNELQTHNAKLQTAEDYSKQQLVVDTVKKAIFPGATDPELMLFFHKCQTVGVHPLAGMIHPLKFRQTDGTFKVSFIVSIDLLRSRSDKPEYDGVDAPEYTGEKIIVYEGTEIKVPEMATVKVYRKDRGRPFVGIARWDEFYPGDKKGHQWRGKPYLMLAKCAEAQARRQAFPQDLDKLYTAEELEKTTEMMANVAPVSSKPSVDPNQVTGDFSQFEEQSQNGKPTEAERSSKKLINENQVKRFYAICNSAKVDPKAVCNYLKVTGPEWITWDKNSKFEYAKICKTIEEKPEFFDKYKPVEKATETPAVMGEDEFRSEVMSFLGVGYTESDLNEELSMMGIDSINAVPVERQQEVLDMLRAKDQAGA